MIPDQGIFPLSPPFTGNFRINIASGQGKTVCSAYFKAVRASSLVICGTFSGGSAGWGTAGHILHPPYCRTGLLSNEIPLQ
jgi:hypothetical protein